MASNINKPLLIVDPDDPPATARRIRDVLAASGDIFERGGTPVKIVVDQIGRPPKAMHLTPNGVTLEVDRVSCPVMADDEKGERRWRPTSLPDKACRLYLEMVGERNLRTLAGITTAPVLFADGSMHLRDGYNAATGLWCAGLPAVCVPDEPTLTEAKGALEILRQSFRTFPFADSKRIRREEKGLEIVDTARSPGMDESIFLNGLICAICRPSLPLAPGLVISGAGYSGAGTGKGFLVRAIGIIAYGAAPESFTKGSSRGELEKRLAAELIEASPFVFLDNVNETALKSDFLASVVTEPNARTRILNQSRNVALNSKAFVAITGNALTVSEDLARRFLVCRLDAQCENPESRPVPDGFLDDIASRRDELLVAGLTIFRYGRQNAKTLKRGKKLGNFEEWCDWVRDVLFTLGCLDPVERVSEIKADDPKRREIVEIFETWRMLHGSSPMKIADLAPGVLLLLDPLRRGRQFVASRLREITNTHLGGYILKAERPTGRWGATKYAVLVAAEAGDEEA